MGVVVVLYQSSHLRCRPWILRGPLEGWRAPIGRLGVQYESARHAGGISKYEAEAWMFVRIHRAPQNFHRTQHGGVDVLGTTLRTGGRNSKGVVRSDLAMVLINVHVPRYTGEISCPDREPNAQSTGLRVCTQNQKDPETAQKK